MSEAIQSPTHWHDRGVSDPSSPLRQIRVGMIGLGTVGTGVYKILAKHPEIMMERIAIRDLAKHKDRHEELPGFNPQRLSTNPYDVVRDENIDLVIELMGGVDPARELVIEALERQKHVVTANKELIAKHGPELFDLARARNVRLLFEGAVAGGIPIIVPLKLSLAGNEIQQLAGILNGTCNYILTKMSQEGLDFNEALRQAQEKGFAEADPTNDVEGHDTAYKMSILSTIAFKKRVDPSHIYCKGITNITDTDITIAKELGYTIKLLGFAQVAHAGQLDIRVHPMLVPHQHPLASIHNEYNAIWIKGDAVGDVMFYGKGAGELPTASAVTGDILAITTDLLNENHPIPTMQFEYTGFANILPVTETKNRYYIRLTTSDVSGVIGHLGQACGMFDVSLSSVVQKGTDPEDESATIILVTHDVYERQMRSALEAIVQQETTRAIGCVLRVL